MTGRMLDSFEMIPRPLLEHLGDTLGIAVPTLASLRALYSRRSTLFEHQRWAAQILGFQSLTDRQERYLATLLRKEAQKTVTQGPLLQFTKRWLYEQHVLIPGERRLLDLVRAAIPQAERDMLEAIASAIPEEVRARWLSELFHPHRGAFLIGDAAAVIDHAVEHQQRMAASLLEPSRAFDVFQVRRAQVEMPAVVAVTGLEANGRRHTRQGGVVVAPLFEVAVDSTSGQHGHGCAQQSVRGLDTVLFEQADRLDRGKMAPLLIAGADLQRGDDLAEALKLGLGQYPRNAAIRALKGLRPRTRSRNAR